jgi:prepilin-type N-terminal cleavage/methylation domain-containing protein
MIHPHHRRGFTLIELLMVVAIIAILGSMIFLSTRDLLAEMKVQKTAGTIVSAAGHRPAGGGRPGTCLFGLFQQRHRSG